MSKELKKRILVTLSGVIALLFIVVGTSYALFHTNISGKNDNTIKSGCLKVEMIDDGSINMDGAVPIKDEEGMKNNPYSFSISNTCSANSFYTVTLNVMKGSSLENTNKIKVYLTGADTLEPTIESKLEETYLLDSKIKDVLKTYKLSTGFLSVGETKSFKLYSWIDYNVETFEGSLENKVIVNNTAEN